MEIWERAYLAGLIDGEGSFVSSWRGRSEILIRLSICNTDVRMIDWVADRCIGRRHIVTRGHLGQKDIHWFNADGSNLTAIVEQVLPYLIVKRRQAELCLHLLDLRVANPGRRGYPPDLVEKRRALYQEMRALNRKGVA